MARLTYWRQNLMTLAHNFTHARSVLLPLLSEEMRNLYRTLFSWSSSSRTAVSQPSHGTILYFLCLYKVPSGSELPTREMAYHRAQINVMIFPGSYPPALLRGFGRDKSVDAGIMPWTLKGYS